MNPFQSLRDYEEYVYTLRQRFSSIAELASSLPHHKHIPPDIKHHRLPAPNMSFIQPNLAALIQEIENLIASKDGRELTGE